MVTNLAHTAERIYRIYRRRGDVENRIRELKGSLYLDRISCTRFWANQLRVLLTATAYVLLQELRRRMMRLDEEVSQVETIRLRLLEIGAQVEQSARRFVLHLAASHPWTTEWTRAARLVGAIAT